MKKIIPIMIATTMVLTAIVAVTDTDSDADFPGTYINGQLATNGTIVDKDNEHWAYFDDGMIITGTTVFSGFIKNGDTSYCIYDGDGGTLNLILNGDLTINAFDPDLDAVTLAIYTSGSLHITGSGKLTIKCDDEFRNIYQGLTAGENITIKDGEIEIWSDIDVTASQVGWDTSFTMSGGELNLFGSGTINAENVYIKGGKININSSCGTVRNRIAAYSDHGESTLEMTGGYVKFTNVRMSTDNPLMSSTGNGVSHFDVHDADGTNWTINEDNNLDAIEDGDVTVMFDKSIHNSITKHSDEPVVLGATVGCAALGLLIVVGMILIARKK